MTDDGLPPEGEEMEVGPSEMAWSQVWQLPVLLLGVGLLAVGVYFALPKYVPTDYEAKLASAEALVVKNRQQEAEAALTELSEDPDFMEAVPGPTIGHYWQLYGDLRFRQLDDRVWQGITTEVGRENLEQVAGHYREAQRQGRELPAEALWRYAQVLAALGDDQGALAVVDQMPAGSVSRRHEIVKSLVERAVQTDPDPSSEKVANLLRRFEAEVGQEPNEAVRRREKIWAMQLRAERLLRAGDEQAVIRMLVEGGLQRLMNGGATDEDLAPLYVVLAEAYAMEESFVSARQFFDKADRTLEPGHALYARVLVGLAGLELAESHQGYIERAFGLFHQAYLDAPAGPSSIDAKIGEAHTEAYREGRFREALEAFELAAERVANAQLPSWDPRREKLIHYLDVHIERELETRRYENALALLEVVAPLLADSESVTLTQRFAQTYRHLAEASLAMADQLKPDPNRPGDDPNLEARRIHNQDAAVYFEQAGRAFRRQAELLRAKAGEHGEVLWDAAECFSQAQLWDDAVAVYQDILGSAGDDAGRQEAMFRLGQAFLADGQYGPARDQLRGLIDASETSEWSKRAYVPLSRALVAMDEWDQGEQLLRHVVEDHRAIGPESPYYRDALIELGTLYYRRGTHDDVYYARAIEVLGDQGGAVERYATPGRTNIEAQNGEDDHEDHTLGPRLRYMLADCLRLSAQGLAKQAAQAPNPTDRLELQAERVRRLRDAGILYDQVLTELNGFHVDSLSRIERVYLRNAYFYKADCAYARSDYRNAILLYQDAATRWQDHPSSLVALVQIVNAAAEMGDFDRARAAHRQAVDVFNKLPESVFDHPDSLMTRQRWDDWLRWSTELDLYPDGSATAGVPTNN